MSIESPAAYHITSKALLRAMANLREEPPQRGGFFWGSTGFIQ